MALQFFNKIKCKNKPEDKPKLNNKSGFSIIEVLLAVSLFGIFFVGFIGAVIFSRGSLTVSQQNNRAIILAQEGVDVVRNKRDADFANLADGTYGLVKSGNSWSFDPQPDVTDVYTRTVIISTIDPNTRQIDVTIDWNDVFGSSHSRTLTTSLTDWPELIIAGDPPWTNPVQLATLDLSGGDNSVGLDIVGDYIALYRDRSSEDLTIISVTDPANPVFISGINLPDRIADGTIFSPYVFLGSSDRTQELQQVDASNPSAPVLINSYDGDNRTRGPILGVTTAGDYLYAVRSRDNRAREFYIFDISNPAVPGFVSDMELNQGGLDIYVTGDYAYVLSDQNNQPLEIIDIGNPLNPTAAGTFNYGGNQPQVIKGRDDFLFIGGGDNLVYILDITNPTAPVLISSYDFGGSIFDISFDAANYLFAAVNNNSQELQVINISDINNPQFVGSFDTPGTITGVEYSASHNLVFASGNNNNFELQVYAPQ